MKFLRVSKIIVQILACVSIQFSLCAQSLEDLNKHDLSWITSDNDFDQISMTKVQIALEIEGIIKMATQSLSPVHSIDIPINSKKILYKGHLHPNETGLFDSNPVSSANSSSINKKLHIYVYDDFIISTENNSSVDQWNVYYSIRAVEILKARYKLAYNKLFESTRNHWSDRPDLKPFSNSNKAFWIAFNESPAYIAVSYTSFLGEGYFPNVDNTQIGNFKNIPIINIHSKNILGEEESKGSRPIYNLDSAQDNYNMYMREGLIETLIHEMIHRYVDYLYPHDQRMSKIRESRDLPDFNYAEECAVLNTSLSYFLRMGGLADSIYNYYFTNVFDYNIGQLDAKQKLDQYSRIFTDTVSSATEKPHRKLFKLLILNE